MRQATHVTGIRRARYIGLDKTRLEHAAAAAAVNLIRLMPGGPAGPSTGPGPPVSSGSISLSPPSRITNRVPTPVRTRW